MAEIQLPQASEDRYRALEDLVEHPSWPVFCRDIQQMYDERGIVEHIKPGDVKDGLWYCRGVRDACDIVLSLAKLIPLMRATELQALEAAEERRQEDDDDGA